MTKRKITRHFNVTFDEVIKKSQSVQPQYVVDQPQFLTFNPIFTVEFGQLLKADTDVAKVDTSGNDQAASIRRLTELIAELRHTGGKQFQKLLYYVHQALGETKSIDSTFGRPDYKKALYSESKMIAMLSQAVRSARSEAFNAQLLAKGMPAELLNEMDTTRIQLSEADDEQESLKKTQLLTTDHRLELYNSIWDRMVEINTAAKVLFADDATRMSIYQLYTGGSGGKKLSEQSDNAPQA